MKYFKYAALTILTVSFFTANSQIVYDEKFYEMYRKSLVNEYVEAGLGLSEVEVAQRADEAILNYKSFRNRVDRLSSLRHEADDVNNNTHINFVNYGFEEGSFNGWKYTQGTHPNCNPALSTCNASTVDPYLPYSFIEDGLRRDRIRTVSGTGVDPIGGFPIVKKGGNYSLKLGNLVNGNQVDRISQDFTVSKRYYTYDIAVVLENPLHQDNQRPFFSVRMFDLDNGGTEIPCARYVVVSGPVPGFSLATQPNGCLNRDFTSRSCDPIYYRPWTANTIDLKEFKDHRVRIEFTVSDCSLSLHAGYAYIDGGIFDDVITTQGDLCVGENIQLDNLISGNIQNEKVNWTLNNQSFETKSVCYKFPAAGTYEVSLDYIIPNPLVPTCRTQTFSKSIVIVEECNNGIDFTANPLCVNSPIKFALANPENYLSDNYKFSWNFGDNNSSENSSVLREPCHTYSAERNYQVNLNVNLEGNECVASKNYSKIKTFSIINCSSASLSALGECSNRPIALRNKTNSVGPWSVDKVEEDGTVRNVASETAAMLCKTFAAGSYKAIFGSGGTTTTSNGCAGSVTLPPSEVSFTVNDCTKPVISYQGELCAGATIALQSSNTAPYVSLTPQWTMTWQRHIDWDPEKLNKFNFCQKFDYPGDYRLNLSFQPENNGCEGSDALVTAAEKIMKIEDCPPPIIVADPVCLTSPSVFKLVPSQTATSYLWKFGDGTTYSSLTNNTQNPNEPRHTFEKPGSYTVTVDLSFASQNTCNVPREIKGITGKHDVENCKPRGCAIFHPEPGKKYLISGWASEERITPVSTPILNYTHAKLIVSFMTMSGNVVENFEFAADPNTPIIDGWQKIEGVLTTPLVYSKVSIQLAPSTTDENVNIYYDDIRFHPFDANMKSSVYDPQSLRLMAELDENNYATFYEYDKEGKLIRIKKETERGIKTVKEFRDNIYKVEPN